MEFIKVYNEKEYFNHKYLLRSYSKINKEINSSLLSNYESIKEDCLYKKKYHLVECKTKYYRLCWDIDFKKTFPWEIINQNQEITIYIIDKINETLNDLIIMPRNDYVYAETSNGFGKHIYYPEIIVDKVFHLKLYDIVIEKINREKKYFFGKCDIIDKSVCDNNGLRLFGSPNDQGGFYYPVKEKSTYKITGDIEKDFDYCLLNTEDNKYNFELKIQIEDVSESETDIIDNKENNNKSSKTNIIKKENNNSKIYTFTFDEKYTKIKELLEIIQDENQTYDNWLKIGMGLYTTDNSENMMQVWYNWSSIDYKCNFEEIKRKWKSFKIQEKNITLGTIRKRAKDKNYELYVQWYNKNYKNEIINLIKDFDQQTVAIYFKNKKSDNYIFIKGEWFALTDNNLWKQLHKNDTSKLINDITETVKNDLIELKNNLKPEDETLKLIPSVSKKLGTSKFICGVIDFLKDKYCNDEIEFNTKSYLFGFTNVVYDLNKNIFRNYEKDDYISMTTGYKWIEPDIDEINEINKILSQVHIDEEIRNFYLDIMCSGLWGTTLQYYIMFNGSGSNGKSVLNDLIMKAFGDYGKVINPIMLCEHRKQGANTELANLHFKRIVIAREPPKKQNIKLSNSMLKELTGASEISARKIYSENEKTILCLTLIIECNKKPLLEEEPTEADARRIIDLLFESKFTDDKNLINNINIFPKKSYYTEEEFRNKYKYALLKILFEHNKNHYYKETNNNYNKELKIPDKVQKRTKEYMESSIEIFEWFMETFEKTDNDEYVTFQDINEILKNSEYYNNLSKFEKRKLTKEKIITLFKEHPVYKINFADEINTHKNGNKFYLPNRLNNFILKKNLSIEI